MIKKLLAGLILVVIFIAIGILLVYIYNTKIIESEDPIDSAPATTKFIDIGGEQIAYSEINNNSSTTVIFVGGLSAWNGTWERVMGELNNKRKDLNYIALDLPPFGYTIPNPLKTYFRDVQAERLATFVNSKGINSVILVGHSYGAGPATEYALQNQDTIKKLILIDAVLNIDEKKVVDTGSIVHNDFLRSALLGVLIHNDSFALSRLKTFVYVTDNINQELLDVYTRYFNTKNTTARLSGWFIDYVDDPLTYTSNASENYTNMAFPVRLIWGDRDTITPIEGTEPLLTTVPDIQLLTLTNIGHIPMIEDYRQFDSALIRALAE